MLRIIISTTLFALWSCTSLQSDLPSTELAQAALPYADPSTVLDDVDVPVIDIASTARSEGETICEHRAPAGSRIRGLYCRDKHARKMTYGDFVSMPDGLKPAAILMQP